MILASGMAPRPYFERLPRMPHCAACKSEDDAAPLVDAVYCISVQAEEERAERAAAHLHKIGLCRQVTFYRPPRGSHIEMACWASHRDVARHAMAQNCASALILEDDVEFLVDWPTATRRIARAMARLPRTWRGFYLGHWPMQAYFVGRDVLRTRSACTHAYIARWPLLDWIARSRPLDAGIPALWPGSSIDTAIGNLPEMYALFPMIAVQRPPTDFRYDRDVKEDGSRHSPLAFDRHRYWIIHHAMRPGEILAALASPLHWAIMRLRGMSAGQTYRLETKASRRLQKIRDAKLFDEAFYLEHSPDVGNAQIDPLTHYLGCGENEGRMPHPLFDPDFYRSSLDPLLAPSASPLAHYLEASSDQRKDPHPCFDSSWYVSQLPESSTAGKAPLVHYLQSRPSQRVSPHPCFDEAWYRARYADVAASGEAGLVHYLKRGWRQGHWPHPLFDPNRYLAENPDVAAAGVNPWEHYVRHGQAEGRVGLASPSISELDVAEDSDSELL